MVQDKPRWWPGTELPPLHPTSSPSVLIPVVLKVWVREPLRVPGILSRGPQGQAWFPNNILFVFLLSFTHKCTVGTSKGYLGEEAVIRNPLKSLLTYLPFSSCIVERGVLPMFEPK